MDSLCCVILIFVGCYVVEGRLVENEPLYTHGIIYEKLENVKFQFGEWTFHSSLKLDLIPKEIRVIEVLSKYMNESCSKLDSDFGIDCEQILHEIGYEISNLEDIKNIISAQCNINFVPRVTRQINFIGHIFKEITGIMDSDDSKRLDTDLSNIQNNEQQLKEQLQRQKIAIDSIFGVANQTIFNVQSKLLNFSHTIEAINNQKNDQATKNLAMNHINGMLGEMNLLLTHVVKRKDIVLSLMRTGEMDLTPDLLSPTALLTELIKTKGVLCHGCEFPVELDFKNIMKFYKFSKVVTKLKNCELVVNITIPTYSNVLFETYKGTSVPMFKDNKLFIVGLENDILLKSYNNSIVSTLKYKEYLKCSSIQDIRLCPFAHTYKTPNTSENCNVEIFFNKTVNSCNFQPLNLKHQLWIQMADRNSWIYAIPNSTIINIITKKKISKMELSGIGKLRITDQCLIKAGDIYLHYFATGSSDFEFVNVKIDFPQAPQEIKLIDEKIPDTIKDNAISGLNEKTLFDEINDLKVMNAGKIQLMNIELEKHSFSIWKTILIIISICVVIWLTFKVYKYLKLKFGGEGRSVVSRPPRPSAPPRFAEPLQVVFTARDTETDAFLENSRTLVNSNRNSVRPTRQVLGQISF